MSCAEPTLRLSHWKDGWKEAAVGISISLLLIAVGAILTWAVTATVSGVDVTAVGVILMIVGAFGLVLSLLLLASWRPWGASHSHYEEHREDRPRRDLIRDY